MMAYYRERFANAADFTFFMVGAFELEPAIALLERYVGSLPSSGRDTAAFKDLNIRFPEDTQSETVEKGREPRSSAVISFFADPSPDPVAQELIGAATTVVETTLRDILREDLGQTYTVSVGRSQPLPQRGAGHIQVRFGAAPEHIKAMADRVLAEVKKLQEEGPSVDLTNRAKESARRGYETSLRQNGYWMGRLQTIHMLGGNPGDITTRLSRIDAVTPEAVQQALRDYFPLDRYTIVTLMPEPGATP
jgi:zinc protease